jgi:hypothetical protein
VDTRAATWPGVAAVVLTLVAFAVGGSPSSGTSSAKTVAGYYAKHAGSQTTSGVLLSFGALLFVVFAATSALRNPLMLVGSGLVAAGLLVLSGLSIALADVAKTADPAALQSLNVLANDAVFVFLITIGSSAFLFGVSRAKELPSWLGKGALVFAVVGVIPSHVIGGTLDHIGLVAFAGLGLWTLIASVLLARRSAPTRS